jgi:hypothetical protein
MYRGTEPRFYFYLWIDKIIEKYPKIGIGVSLLFIVWFNLIFWVEAFRITKYTMGYLMEIFH